MADPMRVRALEQGGVTEIKVLMRHDMETGLRKDPAGKLVPAHFIQQISVRHKDREVLSAQFGPSISKDPFVGFRFKGGVKGDKITVTWIDNLGDKRSDEAVIA
jgi:sulfur-oxidizing protein SoxZ